VITFLSFLFVITPAFAALSCQVIITSILLCLICTVIFQYSQNLSSNICVNIFYWFIHGDLKCGISL